MEIFGLDFEEWYETYFWWADKDRSQKAWHAARNPENIVPVLAERAACAKVCEDEICACCWTDDAQAAAEHIADTIRKRSNVDVTGAASSRPVNGMVRG